MADEPKLPRGKAGIILTALTLTAPLTAGIWTCVNRDKEIELAHISKERETSLAEKDQGFKMQMGALDRAIDPQRPPQDRRQVLRFLSAVTSDSKVKTWADSELKVVQDELEQEKKKRSDVEAKAATLTQERDDLRAQATEKGRSPRALAEIKLRLQNTEAELARKEAEIARMTPPASTPLPTISSLVATAYTTADCDPSSMPLLIGCSLSPSVPANNLFADMLSWTGLFGVPCSCKKRSSSTLYLPPTLH
jgi:hypothetical protein